MYVLGHLHQRTTEATTGRDVIQIAHSSCSKENMKAEGIVLRFTDISFFEPEKRNKTPELCMWESRALLVLKQGRKYTKKSTSCTVKSIYDGIAQKCLCRTPKIKIGNLKKKRFQLKSSLSLCLCLSLSLSLCSLLACRLAWRDCKDRQLPKILILV